MTEKRYATNVSIIIGVSAVLALFFFVLVDHHRDTPDQVRQHRGALLASGSSVAEGNKSVAQVGVASAETRREPAKNAVAAPPPGRDGQQVYQAACVVCHGAGIAGAPKLGDKDQWAKRIAKGLDTLYASAVNGVQGSAGAMPAKGGNAALSDAEVKAAVDYIVAQSK
ncbi:MAG: c-type cytochrome [Gammaproteobacteria bacterium]